MTAVAPLIAFTDSHVLIRRNLHFQCQCLGSELTYTARRFVPIPTILQTALVENISFSLRLTEKNQQR